MERIDSGGRREFLWQTFHNLLVNTPDMIFAKNLDLVYVAASDSFARMIGRQRGEELVGKSDFEIFPEELARKYTRDDKALLSSGTNIVDYIEPLPDQEGKRSYSSTSKYLVRNDEGEVIGIYGVARDVTAQMELQAATEKSSLSLRMFDDVLEADLTENRMINIGGGHWGYLKSLQEGDSFSQAVNKLAWQAVHPDYAKEFSNYYDVHRLRAAYENGVQDFAHVTYLRDEQDATSYHWVEMGSQIYHSRVSNSLRLTTFLKDVDDEICRKKRLEYEASTDALTGLYNRASVLRQISAFLKEEGNRGTHAMLFIDLDNFKKANDFWGHQFGDQVLQEMSMGLRGLFSSNTLFGRIGGDEFLVFLKNVDGRETVRQQAEQVLEKLRGSYCRDGVGLEITCSVGVSLCQGGERSAAGLYEQADLAMYRAKEQGRARLYFYEDLEDSCEKDSGNPREGGQEETR